MTLFCMSILQAPEYAGGEAGYVAHASVGRALGRVCHPLGEAGGVVVCVKPAGMGVVRFFWLSGVSLRKR
jgi:hypothetical protein